MCESTSKSTVLEIISFRILCIVKMINIRILCIVMMNETIPNTDEELFLKEVSKEWRIHTYTDVIVSGQTKNNITNGWFRSIISFIIIYLTASTPTIKEDFISNGSTNYWFCWSLLVSTSAILITIIWYHSNYFYNVQVTTFTIFKFILITTEKSCIWFVFIIYGCLYFIYFFFSWIFFCISFNSSSEGVNDRTDFTFDVSVIHRSLLLSSILISLLREISIFALFWLFLKVIEHNSTFVFMSSSFKKFQSCHLSFLSIHQSLCPLVHYSFLLWYLSQFISFSSPR